jgi:hypothetical protein
MDIWMLDYGYDAAWTIRAFGASKTSGSLGTDTISVWSLQRTSTQSYRR